MKPVEITRRHAIKVAGLLAATSMFRSAFAQTTTYELNAIGYGELPFKLPPLPYALDALEPHITAQSLEIHYKRIHGNYVVKLNQSIGRALKDVYVLEGGRLYARRRYQSQGMAA